MGLKITTLSENTAGLGCFLGEWGLSILVETGDLRVLLDAGQSISAAANASLLGIDLSRKVHVANPFPKDAEKGCQPPADWNG